MKALVILFKGEVIPTLIVEELMNQIARNCNLDPNTLTVNQLNDIELVAKLAISTVAHPVQAIRNDVIALEEIQAAVVYLTELYGDPLDNEDAFRVRLQKIFWGGNPHSDTYKRTVAALEIFSRLNNQKLPIAVNTYLKEVGFTFMKSWSHSLFRYKDM